ncbi:YdcH family protein [Thalassotalea mangrovi]|uniref:DUF465 domain-containing protein n=1 Tax=Thalassotalea mangrovi TaxID=2572245 RepID=A0A4V5NX51_9GAMM|nr:DUF465 domain-containing protein [Thalassotalea mangrovi]TKB44711.1 DUF465 domain-containing protein [Thalassotalea mangrovi]
MPIENHALDIDFPEYAEKIQSLKATDTSFKSQSDEYHQLDKKIRTLEENNVPTDDEHFNEMKMQRAALKDILYARLKADG